MSVTVDANVLLYASDTASRYHERALQTLNELAGGPGILYIFWPVAMAYLRIATHPTIFARPLVPDEAVANIDTLIGRPNVRTPGEADDFWTAFRDVTEGTVVRGNLVPDAHLVALMRQSGVREVVSHDRDLRRFTDIKVRDPFT